MTDTLLAIHAHPDDESSKGAATVAKYVAGGVRAVLVTATGGEAGDILNPAMDTPEVAAELASIRRAELREAADIIGYDDVIMLGHRDSGMPDSEDNRHPSAFCNQPHDAILGSLVEIVRRERPTVVLGYDDHEFYPHPDHLFVHRLSMEIMGAASDPTRFPDAGEPWKVERVFAPVFTGDRILTLHDAMMERTGSSPFSGWIERIGDREVPDRRLIKVDVTGYIEQGRDALRAHRTQIDPDGFWFQVPTELVEDVYPWEDFELLASAHPADRPHGDLFDGLS
jgi:mycothiol S-conjugate amidase